MKFLILTLGSIGDLLPFMAVAEALRQRGHKIVIASNAGYAPLVRMAGFEFAAIWDRAQRALDDVIGRDPRQAWNVVREEMFIPATQPAYDVIAHHARSERCVILASWSVFGARLAHENLRLPLCTAYLSPQAIQEDQDRDIPKTTRAPHCPIGFFPEWFCPPEPGWPAGLRLTGFPMLDDALVPALPAQLEAFLQQGPPPVIFTPGSFMRRAQDFFRESLAACTRLGLRAVFLTPYQDQVPARLPPEVLHFKYVPLQRLAARAAALVHHGGIGTCAQAMRAGIAQLAVPLFFDQFDNAGRIAALGVGNSIAANRYGEEEAGAKLHDLLHSPLVKENCARINALFSPQAPVQDICEIAESAA